MILDEDGEEISPACAQISEWIASELSTRDFGNANRASSAPQCVKKRWFQNQGFKGEKLSPRMISVFMTGDLIEHKIKHTISKACVGEGRIYSEVDFGKKTGTFTVQHREFDIYEQETLHLTVGNIPITCHADGWGKRNADGKWELIEIKSASNKSYSKFVNGEVPDYIRQVHTVMMSDKAKRLGVTSARFFYERKETSHLYDRVYAFDDEIASRVCTEFIAAASAEEPERPFQTTDETVYNRKTKTYDPTGRKILGYPCTYCEYKSNCFENLVKEFKGAKPLWLSTENETTKGESA